MSHMYGRFRNCEYPFFSNCCLVDAKNTSVVHSHDFPHLWYCLEGRYTHIIDFTSYKLGAGSLVIIPPGVSHDWSFGEDESAELVQVNLMFNLFDGKEEREQQSAIMHLFLPSFSQKLGFSAVRIVEFEGRERKLCDDIFRKLSSFNWKGGRIENFDELKRDFFKVFSLSAFDVSEKSKKAAADFIDNKFIPLLRTVYYMNLNYNKNIDTEELLALSNMCQTDYYKNIKLLLGCTWSKYIQLLRVRHAVQLSSFSRYPLNLISDRCGFGDISYMTRQVKRLAKGHLPGEMKKNRDMYISNYPDMDLKELERFEKPIPHFYAFGIK